MGTSPNRTGDLNLELEVERLRRESALYLRLLSLGGETELEPFLQEALSVVVDVTSAQNGYLELYDVRSSSDKPSWFITHGFSSTEADDVRASISRGIIAQAIASGQTIDTPSALLDPRFSERESVQVLRIDAVLCIPIGADPPIGALYLQGRKSDGPFEDSDRQRAETFAHHVGRMAEQLFMRLHVDESSDPTEPFRRQLSADTLVGRSQALAGLMQELALVSPLDVSLLITGESGTGKSHMARIIHDNGPRRDKPFIEVNCGAIPEGLVESELFGALQGSHSTASRRVMGKVEAAEGGTLFLDEVGDLSAAAQAKLLQLLQSGQYYPLGAPSPSQANIRVIGATNIDLEQAVADGRFREDLYYRLHVLPLRVPSLAERRDDIPVLAEYFCKQASERHRLPALTLSPAASVAIELAEWPGNIRQLEHATVAAVIRASGERAEKVERKHFFPEESGVEDESEGEGALTFQEETRRFQAKLLSKTLDECGWNVSEAARRLDMARSHVYNLIRAFDLKRS
jgi:Nif-specific regulatory protein